MQSQLSRVLHLVRSMASYVQLLEIYVVSLAALTRDDPIFSSGNMSHGHGTDPLLLDSHGPRHGLQWQLGLGQVWLLTKYLSTLESPFQSLLVTLKLLHFSFPSTSPPHTYTLW